MRRVIFYSWQSDLPNATNRGLIQAALEIAAKTIAGDDTLDIEPVVDRDTEGVAGSPDIASTIFAKIDAADLVVADVSLVSESSAKRQTPNPNVMIEVGYALKALNFERVILIFNDTYGKIDALPFDLRMRRLVIYSAAADEKDRSSPRRELARKLEAALRSALPLIVADKPTLATAAVEAIENQRPNRRIAIRTELANILKELDSIEPEKVSEGGKVATGEELISAIAKTEPIVARFSKMAETIAVMADTSAAIEVHNWFGKILERYSLPRNFSGAYNEAEFDFFIFIGHELFVSLFAFLLREQQWDMISRLLNEPIPVRYLRRDDGAGNAEWSDISRHVRILGGESHKRQRLSYHGDLLKERHSTGELGVALPFEDFVDADFFLYLKGLLPQEEYHGDFTWRPWSVIWLGGTPRFILRAQSAGQADNLTRALALPSVEQLKKRLEERGSEVRALYRHGFWNYPVRLGDVEKIGSR